MSYLGFATITKIVAVFLKGKSVKSIATDMKVDETTVRGYTYDPNLVATIDELNRILSRKNNTIVVLRKKVIEYRNLSGAYRLQLQRAQRRLEKNEHGNSKKRQALRTAHIAVVDAAEKNKEVSFIMPKKDECVQLERLKLCSKSNGQCEGCKFCDQCTKIGHKTYLGKSGVLAAITRG